MVFCNHLESVERVGKYLQSQKFQCGIFHGGMEQDEDVYKRQDFAVCEFVDSSKLELQRIVRQGLDMLRKEMC